MHIVTQAVEIMETDALPLVIDADYVAVRFAQKFPWNHGNLRVPTPPNPSLINSRPYQVATINHHYPSIRASY